MRYEHYVPPASKLVPEAASAPVTKLPYSGSDSLAFLVPYIGLDIDKVKRGIALSGKVFYRV